MRNLNVVILNGRIGQDFTIKKTQNDKSVVTISLAVKFDKETMWVDVVAWERVADTLDRFCSKGSFIGVEGRLAIRLWEDKQGNKRTRYEVVASNIYLLDAKKESGGGEYNKAKHDEEKKNGYQKQDDDFKDDIPF